MWRSRTSRAMGLCYLILTDFDPCGVHMKRRSYSLSAGREIPLDLSTLRGIANRRKKRHLAKQTIVHLEHMIRYMR